VHAFEHEPGTTQTKVCAACVAATNIGSATVGQSSTLLLAPARFFFAPARVPAVLSV
jgi:hypothetical protein